MEDLNGGAHGVEAAQLHLLLAVRVPRLLVEPEVEPGKNVWCVRENPDPSRTTTPAGGLSL